MPGRTISINRLTLESEQFDFMGDTKRQRPVKVSGIVAAYATAPKAGFPLANFSDGDTDNTPDAMEGCDKGHVIAASLSGVSASENVVPMYPSFNQQGGLWKELENRITSYMTTAYRPTEARDIKMEVAIKYEGGSDPRFPSAFEVTVEDKFGHLYFKSVKLDKLRIPHGPIPAEKVDVTAELGGPLVLLIQQAASHVATSGWKVEDVYPSSNPPNITPLSDVPSRPYAMLDYLWLVRKEQAITDYLTTGTIYRHGHASQFHERQKQLIRAVNRLGNGGYLKSDFPGDVSDNLIVGSGKRSAQVDHVLPYEKYGPNLFSNAMIASGAFNNKARTMDAADKYGFSPTLTMPTLTRHL